MHNKHIELKERMLPWLYYSKIKVLKHMENRGFKLAIEFIGSIQGKSKQSHQKQGITLIANLSGNKVSKTQVKSLMRSIQKKNGARIIKVPLKTKEIILNIFKEVDINNNPIFDNEKKYISKKIKKEKEKLRKIEILIFKYLTQLEKANTEMKIKNERFITLLNDLRGME